MNKAQKEKYYEALKRLREFKEVNVGGNSYVKLKKSGLFLRTIKCNDPVDSESHPICFDTVLAMLKAYIIGNDVEVIVEKLDSAILRAKDDWIFHKD